MTPQFYVATFVHLDADPICNWKGTIADSLQVIVLFCSCPDDMLMISVGSASSRAMIFFFKGCGSAKKNLWHKTSKNFLVLFLLFQKPLEDKKRYRPREDIYAKKRLDTDVLPTAFYFSAQQKHD